MDRRKVLEKIEQCGREDLEEWKKHVLRCKEFFLRDKNRFEVEECNFLLEQIDRRLRNFSEK
ncbi:hypothetical protein [Kyrpidia tusciae]|nr:hypothetical protein [Kyrpidia tusciae]